MSNCPLFSKNKKEIFDFFTKTLTESITTWDYFVNWEKVVKNKEKIEIELNILNSLLGKKENFRKKAVELFLKYPETIKAIPFLLATRENLIKILSDINSLEIKEFNFNLTSITEQEANKFVTLLEKTGLAKLIKHNHLKNLHDYITGVEVGLDTNARKNRIGKLMEQIVEEFVVKACKNHNADYISQATKRKIKEKWNIHINIKKSSKIVDFAILTTEKKLLFIETNFYGGGGSKLKSTAGEYITMSEFWEQQGIDFIWITDGHGWKNTLKPLEEFFLKNKKLLNLAMLKLGCLEELLKKRSIGGNK